MKPAAHIIVSFSLSIVVWFFTKSFLGAVICFLSGTAIDIDHILDYVVSCGWSLGTFKELLRACIVKEVDVCDERFKKTYFLFHSIEIAIILWIISFFTNNIYFFSASLGYSAHLVLDCRGNGEKFCFYFIFWRIFNKFEAKSLCCREDSKKVSGRDKAD